MLYMMVGISGSGKSTYAKSLVDNGDADVIISSDNIREELFGDAGSQEDNKRVFEEFYKRVKKAIKNKKNVVADATFLSRKMRKRLIAETKSKTKITAIVIANKRSACIEADSKRERTVGEAVIDNQIRRFEMPLFSEGINDIKIINRNLHTHSVYDLNGEEINNPHHVDNSVSSHCFNVRNAIVKSMDVTPLDCEAIAGLFHDVGFKWTRSIDKDGVCHYFDHPNVSAYWMLTRRANIFNEEEKIKCVRLINYHMLPYFWDEEKIKDYFKDDVDLSNSLMVLNRADRMCM